MLFSKIWMALLAVAATAALALAFVAPKPLSRMAVQASAHELDRAQHVAELMLRLEARDWIDTAAKMARDRQVAALLEEVNNAPDQAARIKAKLEARLLDLSAMLPPAVRPELMIATDARGKQIFRMGPGEDDYTPGKHGLVGYPLVEAALRGFTRDDTWNVGGKLLLTAGAPVIDQARARYVGAVVLGEAVDGAFARRFKRQLGGGEVAFFLRGVLVGATLESRELAQLPGVYATAERKQEVAARGRTATLPLETGGPPRHFVIMTPLPGQGRLQGAFYAVVGRAAPPLELPGVLGKLGDGDLGWRALPWPLLAGCVVVALVFGLALLYWEVNAPLRRFEGELQKLAAGSAGRLKRSTFTGPYRRMAEAVNAALSARVAAADPAPGAPAARSSEDVLAQLKERLPDFDEMDGFDTVVDFPDEAEIGGEVDPEEAATEVIAPLPERAAGSAAAGGGDQRSLDELRDSAQREADSAAATPPADEQSAEEADTRPSRESEELARAIEAKEREAAELKAYVKEIYRDFVETKRSCGEDPGKVTFKRFEAKLMANRQVLLERFKCKTVKFKVYVKDGKAALKATPVK